MKNQRNHKQSSPAKNYGLKPNWINVSITALSLFGLMILKTTFSCTGLSYEGYLNNVKPPITECPGNYIDTWVYLIMAIVVYVISSFIYMKRKNK